MKISPPSLPLIVLALGLIVYFTFWELRLVPKPTAQSDESNSTIKLVNLSQHPALTDQALLEDSAPLFLPTKWNASISPGSKHFGDLVTITSFPPELSSESSAFFINGPQLPFPPPTSNDISVWLRKPFSTFSIGKDDSLAKDTNASGGLMVITRVGTVGERREIAIPVELLAESEKGNWEPVEFFHTVEHFTAMGNPIQTKFSGIKELDQALARFAKLKVSSSSFAKGYYRITAYP